MYIRFVPIFARISAPLTEKWKKDEPDKFEQLDLVAYLAFACLKELLASISVLAFPQLGRMYTLYTDACEEQVGCVVMEGREK